MARLKLKGYAVFVIAMLCSTLLMTTNANEWFIDINNYALYEMIKDRSGSTLQQQAESILEQILNGNEIDSKYVDSPKVAKALMKKISKLKKDFKASKSGGRQGGTFMDKMNSTVYKMKLSGCKRKIEHELESEKKRRREAEEKATERKKLVKDFKKKAREAYLLLGRVMRRRVKPKRNVAGKENYSRSWRQFKKRQMLDNIDFAENFLAGEGINMVGYKFVDSSGVTVEKGGLDKPITISVDKALFKKDKNLTSDESYTDFANEKGSGYPSLYAVKKRRKELDALFSVKHLPDGEGVYEDLETKLLRVIENIPEWDADNITIKISGDGTSMGSKIHVTNYAFSVFTDTWRSDDLILAITNTPEKYASVQRAMLPLKAEMDSIRERGYIAINGKQVAVKFIICADLKFTNEILGLNACSSIYACAWCHCPSIDFSKVEMDFELRSIDSMVTLARKKKSKKHEPYGCTKPPIFLSIPITDYIPDPLHMYLRISDQLIGKLITELKTKDNINKNSKNVNMDKCKNVSKFKSFIKDQGICWRFETNKTTGLLEHRDFNGPEHRKIQARICLKDLIPWHFKFDMIQNLWDSFIELSNQMKKEMNERELQQFKENAKNWVSQYALTYLAKDVTVYMHIFAKHVDTSIMVHGNISSFSQQSFEKLNDRIATWYFKASNHKQNNALEQILNKQNRIEYLEPTCRRNAKYRITCKLCVNMITTGGLAI